MDRSIFGDKVYATLYYKQHYFTDSQFGCYLTLYDSLLRNTASPRLLILVRCPFEEILRRIRARGRQDEIDAGVEYWRLLFDAYQPFLKFGNVGFAALTNRGSRGHRDGVDVFGDIEFAQRRG